MNELDYINHPGHADHDPAKDENWVPLESKPQAAAAREKTLALINEAQSLLYQAAQVSCPLQGWADQWTEIGNQADATKELWRSVAYAPHPTGHDEFKPSPQQ